MRLIIYNNTLGAYSFPDIYDTIITDRALRKGIIYISCLCSVEITNMRGSWVLHSMSKTVSHRKYATNTQNPVDGQQENQKQNNQVCLSVRLILYTSYKEYCSRLTHKWVTHFTDVQPWLTGPTVQRLKTKLWQCRSWHLTHHSG